MCGICASDENGIIEFEELLDRSAEVDDTTADGKFDFRPRLEDFSRLRIELEVTVRMSGEIATLDGS